VQTTELVERPKMAPMPPVQKDCGVGTEGADFHGLKVHGANAAADTGVIEDRGEEGPAFVFLDAAFGFKAADLLVESVEQLLAGSGAGKSGAVIESAAKAAKIEQALGGAVEHHAHAVEQVDDRGSGVAHAFNEGLIGEKVSAVNGVVEMLVGGVAFALEVLGGVDPALGAHRVGTLDRDDRKEFDGDIGFGDANRRHQAGQTASHDDYFRLAHWT
jgi:hypothetical protein